MAMFETAAVAADVVPEVNIKTETAIKVLHVVGFTQIFALWFEHEGKNLPIEKVGNTKLDQMLRWAEKKHMKDGTKIESKFLDYCEDVSAKTTRAKKATT